MAALRASNEPAGAMISTSAYFILRSVDGVAGISCPYCVKSCRKFSGLEAVVGGVNGGGTQGSISVDYSQGNFGLEFRPELGPCLFYHRFSQFKRWIYLNLWTQIRVVLQNTLLHLH